MKKNISIALATILSLTCLSLNISASAEYYVSSDIGEFEDSSVNLIILKVQERNGHPVYYAKYDDFRLVKFGAEEIRPYFENADGLSAGDMLYITRDWVGILPISPEQLRISTIQEMEDIKNGGLIEEIPELTIDYMGNGIEKFGDDFLKNIRNEYYSNLGCFDENTDRIFFDIIKGDATEDDNVDILDVITINKTVLGKQELNSYAKCVSDVNENGEVDANDSLEIMKYVVGLTDMLGVEA